VVDPGNWSGVFREATWEEALEFAASGLKEISRKTNSRWPASFSQGLQRRGVPLPEAGAHRLRHQQRRPLHAPLPCLVSRGADGSINSGAVSNQVNDVQNAEVIFLIGANPTSNHPVAATWMKNAAKNGVKLIVADPRINELARHATHFLQFKPDTESRC